MPATHSTARKARLQLVTQRLTDEQISELTLKVLAYGDDAEAHAEALLILTDEMVHHPTRADDIAYQMRKVAFARLSEQLIDAQVKLLRGELL